MYGFLGMGAQLDTVIPVIVGEPDDIGEGEPGDPERGEGQFHGGDATGPRAGVKGTPGASAAAG